MSTELSAPGEVEVMNVRAGAVQETLLGLSDLVGRKWQLLIVYHLLTRGGLGFKQLKDGIDGISAKVLSSNLDDLEEKGIVDRSLVETKPVRVEYTLTDRGERLSPLLETVQAEYVGTGDVLGDPT
ncbi:MAG: winged helix-turn-helix transcriptional regulator [Salinirussus sp.]